MNNAQLQDAIDKARAWLAPQVDYKSTPSSDLKDHTIRHIIELQKIQAARAAMATAPKLMQVKS
jgi:hypothetical protein